MYVVVGVLVVGLVLALAPYLIGAARDSSEKSLARKEVEAETNTLARTYKALMGFAEPGENYLLTFESALGEWYDWMNPVWIHRKNSATGAQFPQEFESTVWDRYGKGTSVKFNYRVESSGPSTFTFTVSVVGIAPGPSVFDSKYRCSRTLIVTEADVDFSETACFEY
jgi:type II secretory pathway pseudopilin PulG